ncbi:class I SAM-dependent methyltransferase [Enterococcus sp. BWR-S5]|uniref:class I SAM-dependent methyltransferase n=1 Tax=Enterococcus sp. BWR-S5 TaxID=2787714 RepID=UPI00192452C5|nr:class I SAM-dependent methyltransferase [Enterococcus sp. BWR-S5]MBL1225722.1 class I SAM-dependent methyltransferase [Enterococcus sp. BWR-S5]
MKKTDKKSNSILASEWNNIASFRHKQLMDKKDLSYHYVITPSILGLVKTELNHETSYSVLDAGCGTGNLSYKISEQKKIDVTGIDISSESIEIAQNEYKGVTNLSFKNISIEKYVESPLVLKKYDLVIANMTLMDVSNLDNVLYAISKLLNDNGKFIFSITHPIFWSKYWKYDKMDWFNYKDEIFIEAPFSISLNNSNYITSHVHRPLEMYFEYLSKNNLKVTDLIEPMPSSDVEQRYPEKWEYPRFMLMKCSK